MILGEETPTVDDENLGLTETDGQENQELATNTEEQETNQEANTEIPNPVDEITEEQTETTPDGDDMGIEGAAGEDEIGMSELENLLASIDESSGDTETILDSIESKAEGDDELLKEVSKLRLSEKQQRADIESLNGLVSKLTKDVGDGRMQLAEKEVFGDMSDPKLTVLMKYSADDSEAGNKKVVQVLRDMYEERTGKSIDTELSSDDADMISLASGTKTSQSGSGNSNSSDGPLIF